MSINLYGLTQTVRKPGLGVGTPEELRFVPQEVWSYEQSMQAIVELHSIQDKDEAAKRAIDVVKQALVHPDWYRVDPVEYRQLVPIWNNYFLYFVGRLSGLPQFERYHFADYRRSIRRGIGMCGDASMVLSSVLDRLDIQNRILSFDGHVIVEYRDARGAWRLADPDFGVSIRSSLKHLTESAESTKADYKNAGYSDSEVEYLIRIYRTPYVIFESVYDFMALRFIFEHVSYVLKWVLPILLLAQGLLFWRLRRHKLEKNEGFSP